VASESTPSRIPGARRLVGTAVVGLALVGTALALPSSGTGREGDLRHRDDARRAAALESRPHRHPAGTAPHSHHDPATKNLVSRAGEAGAATQDPTTAAEQRASAAYVARERRTADPELTTVPVTAPRRRHPQDRYAMAGGCYTLTAGGTPTYFKATDLGRYLLYTPARRFVTAGGTTSEPGADTVWTARRRAGRTTLTNAGTPLRRGGSTAFRLTRASGCTAYPESQIGISGDPHAGVTSYQEVRGYVDAHTHGMAFEFLGGDVHCGKPWDRFGAPYALVDCPDHSATQGYGAALEAALSGSPHHDPVGWPTFKDWPAPDSLTHEGTYYRWLERSWRGGQRIFVNLLVENNQLCELYPIKHNSCDDMDSVRLQARDMYRMQDYIDAQFGGPGRGFYRIVRSPFAARRVVNAGKMAVVMGIETSVPFGCTFTATPGPDGAGGGDHPAAECTPQNIDRQLDEVRALGVRQMELVNKFDNALSGIAGDEGQTGVAVNSANFRETNSFWDMRHCEPADPAVHDRNQLAAPTISAQQQDALFGAVGQLFDAANLPAVPAYPPPDHCNSRGLTTLGEHTIAGLAKRHMLFDPDHMSVAARTTALDQTARLGYSGVLSSHSWSTEDAYPRIYRQGGFVAPYAGDSTGFVEKWRRHVGWADPRYYFGIGYGADINGLGAQGDPRGPDVGNPVTYPFRGLNGVRVSRQHAGQRVYDVNRDGVAQYGLYPDWIQDLTKVAGSSRPDDGAAIAEDMSRGAEAYLQMWERAEGIAPDSCRNPGLRRDVAAVRRAVRAGLTTRQVMRAVGQPYTRQGRHATFCARADGAPEVRMQVTYDRSGRVTALDRLA
jgi:hypothetical protein